MDLAQIDCLKEEHAREYLEGIIWHGGVICSHCKSNNNTKLSGKAHRDGAYQCNDCRNQFTLTVGTIMENSHIPLKKWIMAFHLVCAACSHSQAF